MGFFSGLHKAVKKVGGKVIPPGLPGHAKKKQGMSGINAITGKKMQPTTSMFGGGKSPAETEVEVPTTDKEKKKKLFKTAMGR